MGGWLVVVFWGSWLVVGGCWLCLGLVVVGVEVKGQRAAISHPTKTTNIHPPTPKTWKHVWVFFNSSQGPLALGGWLPGWLWPLSGQWSGGGLAGKKTPARGGPGIWPCQPSPAKAARPSKNPKPKKTKKNKKKNQKQKANPPNPS